MPLTAATPEADPTAGTGSTTPSLVTAAQTGDRWAFSQLVDRYQDDIMRMVFYRTRSQMDAEDVTQDVFLKAYQHLTRLKDAQRFKSWLYSIAVNRVRDFNRKKRFRALFGAPDDPAEDATLPETEPSPDALEHVSRKDFWKQVSGFVETLPRTTRINFTDYVDLTELVTAATIPPATYVSGTIRLDYADAEVFVEAAGPPRRPTSMARTAPG